MQGGKSFKIVFAQRSLNYCSLMLLTVEVRNAHQLQPILMYIHTSSPQSNAPWITQATFQSLDISTSGPGFESSLEAGLYRFWPAAPSMKSQEAHYCSQTFGWRSSPTPHPRRGHQPTS